MRKVKKGKEKNTLTELTEYHFPQHFYNPIQLKITQIRKLL